MQLLEGTLPAQAIIDRLQSAVRALPVGGPRPTVAFVLVGEDGPSATYVARKQIAAEQVGFISRVIRLPETVSEAALLQVIQGLNEDASLHGILVQAPLPSHICGLTIFNAVLPTKDVDGFHAQNVGRLCQGDLGGLIPCTPAGVAELLRFYGISTAGKHVVVLGRSLTVGRPAAFLFLEKTWNATVTICHTGTQNVKAIAQQADILIVATGRPEWVNETHVRPGAIVIDVGINRVVDAAAKRGYRLVGDVDRKRVEGIAGALSPVPGGVGPLTVAKLMDNTYLAFSHSLA